MGGLFGDRRSFPGKEWRGDGDFFEVVESGKGVKLRGFWGGTDVGRQTLLGGHSPGAGKS